MRSAPHSSSAVPESSDMPYDTSFHNHRIFLIRTATHISPKMVIKMKKPDHSGFINAIPPALAAPQPPALCPLLRASTSHWIYDCEPFYRKYSSFLQFLWYCNSELTDQTPVFHAVSISFAYWYPLYYRCLQFIICICIVLVRVM